MQYLSQYYTVADPSVRAVKGMGLRPLTCWNCGFESRRRHVYHSLL